jgi:Ca2+-binding RTX toxin-like protein
MLGELGADRMFGQAGEDAMVGDRGSIRDTLLSGSPGTCAATASVQGPTFLDYAGLCGGMKERRVSLTNDYQLPGFPLLSSPGTTQGGADFMRGGPDHDSMHGAAGDDLMNGDSGGDWLLGDNGADKMWGGKGSDDPNNPNDRGVNDSLVDILFGGESGLTVLTSDFLDYRPRPGDAAAWFEITDTANDVGAPDPVNNPTVVDNQHNNGIDLIFGASGRDVLQGNVGVNGPDFGDRLVDWTGAFNLFTRCNASYGDDGDVRQITPQLQSFMETVAYGIGAGESLASVRTAGTSGAVELALVKGGDKLASGKAFPTTPGNFEKPACIP